MVLPTKRNTHILLEIIQTSGAFILVTKVFGKPKWIENCFTEGPTVVPADFSRSKLVPVITMCVNVSQTKKQRVLSIGHEP